MIDKKVAMIFYYRDPELEINPIKPPSSPARNPTNSSQSDNPDMELVTKHIWMHQNLERNSLNFDYHFS